MLDVRRATVFCLGYHYSKHKITDMLNIWGGSCPPGFLLATPMVSTKGILFACSTRYEKTTLAIYNAIFRNNHCTNYVDREVARLLNVYN